MAEGVDYSWARPGGAALQAAGKTFAVRYLYQDGQGGKGLDASELTDLRAHNIAVAVVFESAGNRVLSGRGAGRADARAAQAQLDVLALGDLPTYFAVDFNATAAQQGVIDEYLRGAAEVIGLDRVGLYAGIGPIQRAQANRTATWFWQTYAWSGGRVAPGIHLYQYRNGQNINGSVDLVRSMQPSFGQAATTTASLDLTKIEQEEDDMSRIIHHPNGSMALAGSDGTFVPLTTMDEVAALIGTGAVPKDYVNLADGLMWDLRTAIAARKAAQSSSNPQAVAAALAPLIVPAVVSALGTGLTQEQVEQATEAAVRAVFADAATK